MYSMRGRLYTYETVGMSPTCSLTCLNSKTVQLHKWVYMHMLDKLAGKCAEALQDAAMVIQ